MKLWRLLHYEDALKEEYGVSAKVYQQNTGFILMDEDGNLYQIDTDLSSAHVDETYLRVMARELGALPKIELYVVFEDEDKDSDE